MKTIGNGAVFVYVFLVFAATFVAIAGHAEVEASTSVTAEKSVQDNNLAVGDKAVIALDIQNPFKQDLPIKIADKNVFASNGIDIQCLEYTIPAMSKVRLSYDPIELFSGGKYTLAPAKITYTNPDTQKEETISSNDLNVNIKSSGSASASQQGITTIYKCNGQSMTSTSYSSSGSSSSSFSMQFGSNTNTGQDQQQDQSGSNGQSPADKVQNNQLPQDQTAIKQQMEKQAQEQKKMDEALANALSQNPGLQKRNKELMDQGYIPQKQSVSSETNDTGNFRADYAKPNGDTAKIQGRMENGAMKDMYSQSSDDLRDIERLLENSSAYQQYKQELQKNGYAQMPLEVKRRNSTYAEATSPFMQQSQQPQTNASTQAPPASANITAQIVNNTVQNVSVRKSDTEKKQQLWWLLLLPIVAVLAYIIYKKYTRVPVKAETPVVAVTKPKIDFRAQAISMLEQAKKLFGDGMEKEAYALVSEAVRYYFKEKMMLQKEVTSTELVRQLKHTKQKHADVQRCLNMCGLVEFAKYVPNREDFAEILGLAKGVIE